MFRLHCSMQQTVVTTFFDLLIINHRDMDVSLEILIVLKFSVY